MKPRNIFHQALLVLGLLSALNCSKTDLPKPTTPQIQPSASRTDSLPKQIQVTCAYWQSFDQGIFSHTINSALAQLNMAGSKGLKVSILQFGNQIPISENPQGYLNGSIWYHVNFNDVTIFYRDSNNALSIPFGQLTVKIETI